MKKRIKANPYATFEIALKAAGLSFEKEKMLKVLFSNPEEFKHQYRIDYFISESICVEIEGGSFSAGRHTRGVGFTNDMLKYNSISFAEYPLFRFSSGMIKSSPVEIAELLKLHIDRELTASKVSLFVKRHKK